MMEIREDTPRGQPVVRQGLQCGQE
jgi:hypothetical protein